MLDRVDAAVPRTTGPEPVRELFERIDVGYYEADAAEITSLELDKVAGVEAAFDVLGITTRSHWCSATPSRIYA